MSFQFLMVIHALPLWFLVFALILPRIALFVLWLGAPLKPFHLHGLLPLLFAIFLPRILVLYLIYLDQGISLWFIIHLVAALMVWGGSGKYSSRRRRHRENF
jgi:hypothetical protein